MARSLLQSGRIHVTLLLLLMTLGLSPAPNETPQNAVCGECHDVPGLHYVTDRGERRSYTIPPEPYADSVHGGARCVECHSPGYGDALPHTGQRFWPLYSCVDCHESRGDVDDLHLPQRKQELLGSVHGVDLISRLDCHDCHDPHRVALVPDSAAALDRIAASNTLCLACHGPPQGRRFGYPALTDAAATHEDFPNALRHLSRVKCVGCHSPAGQGEGHDVLAASASVRECVDCHSRSDPRYVSSYGARRGAPSRATADDNVYVIGSTRSVWLDRASQLGFAFFLLLVLVHSVRRRLAQRRYARTRWMHVEGPRSVKGWHLLQVALILGLLASGLSMHYADSGLAPIPFRWAVRAHNAFGIANVALWVGFLAINARTGNLRHYLERLRDVPRELPRQLRYYAGGTFRGDPEPFPPGRPHKFNPLQRIAYLGVMYVLMPLSVVSGGVLLFPLIAPERALGHPGLWPTAMVHLTVAYLLTLFIVVHVYMISAAPPEGEAPPDQ